MSKLMELSELLSVQFGIAKDEIEPNTCISYFDADFLDITMFIMEVERRFGVRLERRQLKNKRTIEEIVAFIESAL